MASFQLRNKAYTCIFCWHGKRQWLPLGAVTEAEAKAKLAQGDYLLLRLKQRLIELPASVGIVDFIKHDGTPPVGATVIPERQELTILAFRDCYLDTHRPSLELRTVDGIELHFKHLLGSLGERFPIREQKLSDLQGYVDGRSKAKGMAGKKLSPATIRKEIVSLRTAWNWGQKMGLAAGRFPYDGLRYPKTDEKPPFQTKAEIERRIAAGGLTKAQIKELWESLYLRAGAFGPVGLREGAGLPSVDLPAHLHGRPHGGQAERAAQDADRRPRFRRRRGHHPREKTSKGQAIDATRAIDTCPCRGAQGLAFGASRWYHPLLPRESGRAEQKQEPFNRPPERRTPDEDHQGAVADGYLAGRVSRNRPALGPRDPRSLPQDYKRGVGDGTWSSRPEALHDLLHGRRRD